MRAIGEDRDGVIGRLLEAARKADWCQVFLSGGCPPCFHVAEGFFCLRAERWDGHKAIGGRGPIHEYVSLEKLLLGVTLEDLVLDQAKRAEGKVNAAAGVISELLTGSTEHVCPECGGRGKVCDPVEIGARLKLKREASGKSGREVARRIGCSAMYICDLEHGRRDWKAGLIVEYLEALRA